MFAKQIKVFLNWFNSRYPALSRIIDWLVILLPPLLLTPLVFIPIDLSLAVFFWMVAAVVFFVSLRTIGRFLWNGPRRKLIRPMLAILAMVSAVMMISASRRSADEYASSLALVAQQLCQSKGECQETLEGISCDRTLAADRCVSGYGDYGSQFAVSYSISPDKASFTVQVRHNIDERLILRGGVHQELQSHTTRSD